MASYKIVFKPSVEKDLRALPQSMSARVFKYIEALQDEPLPRQSIKLAGAEQLYRIRVGDYRVVYSFDRVTKQIIIHYLRHRRDVYRKV
jgi:mRNA interferase RelE/StbE